MNLQNYKDCVEAINTDKLTMLKRLVTNAHSIIILGNGGSNAISCHIAQDYTKVLGITTQCFGDSSRLSCYANDYGWENAYAKFLDHMSDPDTLVILISSSGNSQNILNAAEYCKEYSLPMITMSGFDINNKLKTLYEKNSELHFYVNSTDYGIVECMHELILHSII